HDAIDALPAGSPVLVSMDYDPASQAELEPMNRAVLRHMFRKDLRVTGMTHWPRGRDFVEQVVKSTAAEFDDLEVEVRTFDSARAAEDHVTLAKTKPDEAAKVPAQVAAVNIGRERASAPLAYTPKLYTTLDEVETGLAEDVFEQGGKHHVLTVVSRKPTKEYGKDYCFLGVRLGAAILIINMGQSLFDAFPADKYGTPTRELAGTGKVLEGVSKLGDFKYLACIAAGISAEQWIIYGSQKYGFPMGVGCTAVMAPDLYPYLNSKQITGIVGGAKGAWEYEARIRVPDKATSRVPAQTMAHVLVILLVLFCNVAYLMVGRGGKPAGAR
ncbi:MAG: hypothetical protein L0206_18240, partial [Actinobacteria bacterium]|nr:hypothetical protein [Actinomycetota bacterium]